MSFSLVQIFNLVVLSFSSSLFAMVKRKGNPSADDEEDGGRCFLVLLFCLFSRWHGCCFDDVLHSCDFGAPSGPQVCFLPSLAYLIRLVLTSPLIL